MIISSTITAKEWLDKHNIDLSEMHGNIGDYDGNIFIETEDGWLFWNTQGIVEKVSFCIYFNTAG